MRRPKSWPAFLSRCSPAEWPTGPGSTGRLQVGATLSPALSDSERAGVPRHLYVLVHGLKGQPTDLTTLKESLFSLTERTAVVHLAEANYRWVDRAGHLMATSIITFRKGPPDSAAGAASARC